MPEVIFEVKAIRPPLCSYPGCERINGRVRQAKWLIRRLGSGQEYRPVYWTCKARIKAHLSADEQSAPGAQEARSRAEGE
jgi:hypothetical protein